MKKRGIGIIVTLSLILSLFSTAALAADNTATEKLILAANSTITTKDTDGITTTTITDQDGNVTEISVKVSSTALTDEVVRLPILIRAASSTAEAVAINVEVPTDSITIEIPIERVTPGTTAVIVNKDGTEELVKASAISENGVVFTVDKHTTVKIIVNNKYFSDVHDVSHWAVSAVDFVSARGLYDGTGMNHFSPDEDMTRGMFATVLYRLENNPAYTTEQSFRDVAADAWYADGIYWAVENHLFAGYGNGISGAEDRITREQLVTILYRYAQYKGYDTTQGGMAVREFADYDAISDYARSSMQWAVNAQVISGYNNLLTPQDYATRAQVATILMNFIQGLYA